MNKHLIFAEHLKTDEEYDIHHALVEGGFRIWLPNVGTTKSLLKKHGYQQKGWAVLLVEDLGLTFLLMKFPNLKTAPLVNEVLA